MRLRRKSATSLGRQRLRRDTDVGSTSRKFSYRARRSETEENTGRQLQRETAKATAGRAKHFWLQRFGLIILLLAGLASAINIVSLSTTAKVLPLEHDQASSLLRHQSLYESAASQLLADSVWNRNKITVDTGNVSRKMLAQFPELSSVSITVPLLAHRPLVYVESARPALILVNSSGTFLVDTTGKALLRAGSPEAFHQPTLPVVNDQSGLQVQLNKQTLPTSSVAFIQTVTAQLAAKQFKVASMTLPVAASQLDVALVAQPYIVKFNLQSNKPRQQAGTFLATIAQLQKQNITPGKYVDVRVDGRAYYQ